MPSGKNTKTKTLENDPHQKYLKAKFSGPKDKGATLEMMAGLWPACSVRVAAAWMTPQLEKLSSHLCFRNEIAY